MRRAAGALLLFLAPSVATTADAQFSRPRFDQLQVRAVATPLTPRAGAAVSVAVTLDYPKGLHSWPNKPDKVPELGGFRAFPTSVLVRAPAGISVGAVKWPPPEPMIVRYTGKPLQLLAYAGRVILQVPLQLSPSIREGDTEVEIVVSYQACDKEICYAPRDETRRVSFRVLPAIQSEP